MKQSCPFAAVEDEEDFKLRLKEYVGVGVW